MKHQYIGVDIGGSHITAAVVNLVSGTINEASLRRVPVDSHASADEILTKWATTIRQAVNSDLLSECQIGIAIPGPFDYKNGICRMQNVNKYEQLYGLNIKQELAHRLGVLPNQIHFRNDAEAFLAGEMLFGAGRGFKKGLGITLGTGLGTSIFENGQVRDLALGINHPLHDGVAEDFISTRWFIKRYAELTQTPIKGVKEIADTYKTNPIARQTFDEFAQNIALVMTDFVAHYQPKVIIFGGNIAHASMLFLDVVEAHLTQQNVTVDLRQSALNELASLMGAVGFGITPVVDFQNSSAE
ncbi:MAG: ROK family protein [Spirosomataceae bacterium]